jgi:mRNA-degrading endonuclease toxin of MazEF toxin-antitoxin module
MSKPLLLSSGSGKVLEFVGTATGQLPTWSQSAQEWVLGTNGGSGGGGAIFYLNSAAAADTPTTNVPGGTGGATAYFTPAQLSQTFNATASTRLSPPTGELPSNGSWAIVQGLLSDDALGLTALPPGLWDFNIWAKASTGAGPSQVEFRVRVGVYADSTNTLTYLFDSDSIFIYDPTVAAQYPASVVIGSNTIAATDRLYVEVNARSSANNRTATFYFGGDTPSHVHTTIQVPVNLATGVTGTLPVANGGTGVTTVAANTVFAGPSSGGSAAPGFRALVASDVPSLSSTYLPLSGGTLTGKLNLRASTSATAGINIGVGALTTSPLNGDVWTNDFEIFVRTNNASQGLVTTRPQVNVDIQPTAAATGKNIQIIAGTTTNAGLGGGNFMIAAGAGGSGGYGGILTLRAGSGEAQNGQINIGISTTNAIAIGTPGVVTTFGGRVVTPALTTSVAGFNIAPTAATPTTLVNGDLWTTSANLFVRINGATQTVAPLASPAFTGTPSLPTGTTGVTQSTGNNTTALATTAFVTTAVATSSGAPYDLPFEIPGTPASSTKVVNFKTVRAFALAATGHQGGQLTAPSGNFVCTVMKNGASIGTITFGTSSFSSSVTATSFATGDVLSVETPAAALGIDTPFATLAMTLA